MLIFAISLSTLALRSLYSEVLFTGCYCTARMLAVSFCFVASASLGFRIALAASSLILTDPVVLCLMLAASLVNKSSKLLQFLALVGLSRQVSYDRLKNPVSLISRYAEQRIFFSVSGSSPDLANSFQSSMQVNITAMGVVGSHCVSNAISFSCSCFGRTVP